MAREAQPGPSLPERPRAEKGPEKPWEGREKRSRRAPEMSGVEAWGS